jgi:hypothetical protein
MPEPLIRLLADLPAAEPDLARHERLKARCRERLARSAPAVSSSRLPAPRGWTGQLWQPLIAVLGVAYLTEVVLQTLRFYALLTF